MIGGKSYQESLSVDASINAEYNGGMVSASFSASAGYKKVTLFRETVSNIYLFFIF
jgi:hypothetical protein